MIYGFTISDLTKKNDIITAVQPSVNKGRANKQLLLL